MLTYSKIAHVKVQVKPQTNETIANLFKNLFFDELGIPIGRHASTMACIRL